MFYLQVVFHSAIGKEDGYFDLMDIIEWNINKMVYRHPHVFGDDEANTSERSFSRIGMKLRKKKKALKL